MPRAERWPPRKTRGSVDSVLAQATESAAKSVEDTPNRLAVLKEAGVVDAGGQGVFIILEGLLKHSRGEQIEGDIVLRSV